MSGYTFDQIPQLKQALLDENLTIALGNIPMVNIEDDEWEYLALMQEYDAIFREFYSANKTTALLCFIHLVAASEHIYYTEDWPQFTDLISNLLAVISEQPYSKENELLVDTLLNKLDLKARYVILHGNLNYNLACFFANKQDTKTMMEYVLRAFFSFDKDKFFQEPCFQPYQDKPFFKQPLEKFNYSAATWWTDIWPINDWYTSKEHKYEL
ncbi:hypothetical protein [Tenacibaculum agarivorans]|uniref:hypothetical protein n=1 Tax=Tenacibaculum agarivorans TaxID=1908389 RepID=UPI00094B7990|nr:hypothetical protein [Tenacibaculum agarivorans]